MGIADIPLSLGPSFLIRTFLPGAIASLLYYFTFCNLLKKYLSENSQMMFNALTEISNFTDKLLAFAILGILLGMMLSELDVQIYQFFESLRFWPQSIWNWRYKMVLSEFKDMDQGLQEIKLRKKKIQQMGDSFCDSEELRDLLFRESELSAKAREYPYNPDMGCFCKRYPSAATRFGNVIAEYEQYAEIQYGMHMMVFWQHLWLILPAEVKEDLDLRGAKVDFLVYLSFILLIYAFAGGAYFLYYGTVTDVGICFIASTILSFFFYSASISSVKNYGRYIKAVFDLYRFDLAKKMDIPMDAKHLIPDDEEMDAWRRLRRYLLDYKK
jgi:hypothetical protein